MMMKGVFGRRYCEITAFSGPRRPARREKRAASGQRADAGGAGASGGFSGMRAGTPEV